MSYFAEHIVVIEFADGTTVTWMIPNDDDRIETVAEAIEDILGTGTVKL